MTDADRAAMTPQAFQDWLADRSLKPKDVAAHFGLGVRTIECWANGTATIKPVHVYAMRGLDQAQGRVAMLDDYPVPMSGRKAQHVLDYLARPGITQDMAAARFGISRGAVARLVKKSKDAPVERQRQDPPAAFDSED